MPAAHTWHVITCEYWPQVGGVSDFTREIADGLAAAGQHVHVWSPSPAHDRANVTVHELSAGYRVTALSALDRALGSCVPPRRLLVQWVPHGYGYKSLNLPFCLWLRQRARRGDEIYLVVHEPFLPFDAWRIRQNVGAVAHRLMLRLLLGIAKRVWVSTPSFLEDIRRFGPGLLDARWIPIPSPIMPVHDPIAVTAQRQRLTQDGFIVGHFGTCNVLVAPVLESVLARLSAARSDVRFALLGRGTTAFVDRILERGLVPASSIAICGEQSPSQLSLALQCCDVFVQPYPDGVSSRRTTLMTLLAHGCAIVGCSGPTTEPDWHRDGAIRLAPHGDAGAMAAATLDLIASPAERQRLGARARAAYHERHDVTHAIGSLLGEAVA